MTTALRDEAARGARTVRDRMRRSLRRSLRDGSLVERLAHGSARLGLAARAVFYLLLAGLAAEVAAHGTTGGRQADAHGALQTVATQPLGMVIIGGAALGFAAFGFSREYGAVHDGDTSRLRRATTAGQGLAYLAMAAITASFLAGSRNTGSEQQHERTTGRLLGIPGGREIVFAVGLVLLAVCAWQIRIALRTDYTDGLRTDRMPRPVLALVHVAGTVGIVARALTFVPIGLFLLRAAVTFDPRRAAGLDAVLARLARHTWGMALLAAVVAGFVVFAVYSFLEAAYKDVEAGT